jgi:hypothetical protein
MKPLNEVNHWKNQISEESRQAALDTMILAQIKGLERLIENNGAYVKSALAYNMTAGLIEQLKYYATASFHLAENTINRDINSVESIRSKT